jgi:hypothetical protein
MKNQKSLKSLSHAVSPFCDRFAKRHRLTQFPNSHALRVTTVFVQGMTELHIVSRRGTTRGSFQQSTNVCQKVNVQCVYYQLLTSTLNTNTFNCSANRRIFRVVPTITGMLSHHGKSFYIPPVTSSRCPALTATLFSPYPNYTTWYPKYSGLVLPSIQQLW